MNILTVGCGRVGRALVQELIELGHDVSVIDDNPDNLDLLREEMGNVYESLLTIIGVPIDTHILKQAGIESCDAVAIVTPDNNINIMVAQMASKLFDIKNVLTRISDPDRKEVFVERFGMHAICGTTLTVQSMLAGILNEEDDEKQFVAFGSSTANFFTIPATEEMMNKPLTTIAPPRKGMLVYGVQRANSMLELACAPSPIVRQGDKIVYSIVVD